MRKMNKRGWLRIVEAVLAILLILGAVLVISSKKVSKPDIEGSIYENQKNILEIITSDSILRDKILLGDNTDVNTKIAKLIPNTWDFRTKICEIDEICSLDLPQDKDVYVEEKIVSSTLTNYNPKKIRFFIWMK